MEVYFDNSATTRCYPEVAEIVVKTMTEDFGNPSAMHLKGVEAEKYVRDSAQILARLLKVSEKEIIFTSGGTESNNLALFGGADANKRAGNHIITTAVEHAAVGQPVERLEQMGYEVTVVPVDQRGVVRLDVLESALREDTILVSTMYVNNEVGAVMPVEEIARLVHEKSPKALYHVDAIQAFGKYRIYPKKLGIDMLSVSSHKIHGPKGVGFLYINEKVRVQPQILGGGQQAGMRSGTDNVPGAAGLAQAVRETFAHFEDDMAHFYAIKDRMIDGLEQLKDPATGEAWAIVHSMRDEGSAPHIVSASFPGVRSEVLLHALEDRQIYVSSGSACSSNKKLPVSTVLKEIHLPQEQLESTLRFSFSRFTTEEEIDYCLDALRELLPVLRRYARH